MTDIGVGSWPSRRARMNPSATAFGQGSRSLTYGELARRVDSLAAALSDLGVRHGDRVAYLGPNDIATFETLFAAGHLGAVFVPLNTRLSGREIDYMLTDSGPRVLVYGPDCAGLIPAALAARGVVEHLIALDPAASPGGLDYSVLASGSGTPSAADVTLDDDALILYTSGTTGQPKGAILTHGNITFNTVNQLAQTDVLSSDIVLCTAPLFHIAGLSQVTLPTLFKGGRVVIAPKFDAGRMLEAISKLRLNAFSAVPTMLQMLSDSPAFASADLSSLRYIVYGGSPVLARVAEAWMARGIDLLQGYGMTEAAPGVLLAMPEGAAGHPVSAGVPQFYCDLALELPGGSVTSPHGTGELLVRGPNVFRGYLNRPEETAKALDGGWFHTGDVVRVDDDGWGYVVDRVKDVIISGGENISPAEVEAAIAEMDGVGDCAVVGAPDARWGEVGMAFVVALGGVTLDVSAVSAHLDGRLARYKIPKYIEIADTLPRNATGKIQKTELRRRASSRSATESEHA
jgi:fatty-acyl-CoA synthase